MRPSPQVGLESWQSDDLGGVVVLVRAAWRSLRLEIFTLSRIQFNVFSGCHRYHQKSRRRHKDTFNVQSDTLQRYTMLLRSVRSPRYGAYKSASVQLFRIVAQGLRTVSSAIRALS